MINVETFQVGFLGTNCYIVTDESTKRRAVIDPGYKSPQLVKRIQELGVDTFDYILLTHGHFDHIWYTEEIRALTGAKVVISKGDAPFLSDSSLNLTSTFNIRNFPLLSADIVLDNNDKIMLGETEFTLLSTPGHTVGSSCFISFKDNVIFSGDTLFRLSMGRTDFVTGDALELDSSLKKLASLKGDFLVYPGHNEVTTLEFERKNNPYVSEK
ncbi:MAG: MBL fold metallo-hydrolase [Clostridia bacterium]|nr:MBL fold metallo-hydrolase [Clostridia bacterium]